jgi:hypothetical protein
MLLKLGLTISTTRMFSTSVKAQIDALANSYARAFLLLVILQTIYFCPMLVRRAVIFPHNNGLEVSGLAVEDKTGISNRKFSDQSSQFIPEINQHLNGHHRAWLSTWNPHVQLGRPTFQLSGFGKAYLLTHLLSVFINNPFVLYTCLTILTVYLTGIFCFLFLKALEMHPLACFSIAAGLSLGTFSAYWLTFVMFLATLCWTLALLWLLTEFIKHRSLIVLAGIAFASYSLLMTGYPQSIVIHAYLIVGFTIMRLWQAPHRLKGKLYTILALAGAALIGAVTALPPYLDVLINTQRSFRSAVGDGFFLAAVPSIKSINQLCFFLFQLVDPFWFGNAIKPEYPFPFDGLSLSVFYFILLLLSLADGRWRQVWPWQALVVTCLLLTIWSPAFLFVVHYLGFNISRSSPLGGAIIPSCVLGGYALDHILRRGLKRTFFPIALLMILLLLASIVGFNHKPELQISFVVLSLLLTLATAWFVIARKPVLLILLTIVSVVAYSFTIMLTQRLSEIQTNSALLEKIRMLTPDSSRYAIVGQDLRGILPPNQESLLEINSIHSYESLTPVDYQRVMSQLNESRSSAYRRTFTSIDADVNLDRAPFSYAGVSLLLTRHALNSDSFREAGEIKGIKLYESVEPPISAAQLTLFTVDESGRVALTGLLSKQTKLPTQKLLARDDFMKFQVTPVDQETLLFVSQQLHPYWRATSHTIPLSIVTVNDLYLGVIIPPHTSDLEITFSPFVLWSWIPQAIYVALGLALLVRKLIKVRKKGARSFRWLSVTK